MLKKTLSIAVMALLFGFATQALAQEKEDDGFEFLDDAKESVTLREIGYATSAVDYGYRNNSAISLLQAAEIFAKYPVSPLKIYDENGKPIETVAPPYNYDSKDLLKNAKLMAKDDANFFS